MTTEEAPILRMTRTIGSWLVRLEALSVPQFADQCGGPPAFASCAIERLIAGSTVYETDEESSYTYRTEFPAAVKQQWMVLQDTAARR
jgi:hypothetical protein